MQTCSEQDMCLVTKIKDANQWQSLFCIYLQSVSSLFKRKLITCPSQQLTIAAFFVSSESSLIMSHVDVVLGSTSSLNCQPLWSSVLSSGSVYLTTVTTCFSFSDTTGTAPGLLCLRTFLSLEDKRRRGVNDSICRREHAGKNGKRRDESSANRKEEETEYETIDLTPTSQTTLMFPENNA